MSEQTARRFIEGLQKLEATGDPGLLCECFSDNCEIGNVAVHKLFKGQEGAREFWRKYREMFRDIKSTFRNVIITPERAALEWTSTGTNPKGEEVTYNGVTILEMSDDQITRCEAYFDGENLSRQLLGHKPAPIRSHI